MVLIHDDDHCYTRTDLKCMNMLQHPIWIFDIDTKSMYYANQSALHVWNATTLDELLQRDFASDMSEAALSYIDDLKVNELYRNEYKTEKWTFYPKGIGAQTIDVTFSAVRIENGRIAVLNEGEILDRRSMISDNTARSIEILKHLPVAVSQFTMDGKLMYQNPQACKLFGSVVDDNNNNNNHDNNNNDNNNITLQQKDGNESKHQTNSLLRRFVDVELGRTALAKMQNDDIFNAETQQYTIPDSNNNNLQEINESSTVTRWFNVVLRRTRDPVTSDFVILYIARDVSDMVKGRNDTMQAAMKSEFLDVMAHEIRTPLHQIVGFVDLFEETLFDENQLSTIQQIQSSCSLLIAIINDLLDCSKLEHGQLQIENISFSLENLINGCIASIGPQAQAKNIIVSCNIDPQCLKYIISDPNRIRQVLQNLLSNAIKFTNTGSIVVTIKPICKPETSSQREHVNFDNTVEQWLRFDVTDTGIGMDVQEQTIVFERYRQANASVARHFGGTGLGLPICKGLVELLGGTIGLTSELGIGTSIYFDIPVRQAVKDNGFKRQSSVGANTTNLNSEQIKLNPLNILVVEDNKVNQKVVKAMLQRMGHTVTLAEHGEIALTEISNQRFHMVLMDVQMPVMDGVECTKYIRNVLHFSKEQLPIIGLTAGYQNSDRDYYENDVGMNGCLGKPLPMEKLKQAVAFYQSEKVCTS